MLVYLTAFALSLPFLGAARANFCKWKGIAPQTGGAACAAPAASGGEKGKQR